MELWLVAQSAPRWLVGPQNHFGLYPLQVSKIFQFLNPLCSAGCYWPVLWWFLTSYNYQSATPPGKGYAIRAELPWGLVDLFPCLWTLQLTLLRNLLKRLSNYNFHLWIQEWMAVMPLSIGTLISRLTRQWKRSGNQRFCSTNTLVKMVSMLVQIFFW